MRDPERIDVICGLLATVWKKHPDLRLGQLLESMTIFPATISCYGSGALVSFFQEDDVTASKLRALL